MAWRRLLRLVLGDDRLTVTQRIGSDRLTLIVDKVGLGAMDVELDVGDVIALNDALTNWLENRGPDGHQ